jgi:trimethylamine---corrinoid protein Co-methyltransferase
MTRISERRGERRNTLPRQTAWRRLANPYPPMRVLSDDQVEAVHETSLEILETLGLEILDDGALDRLAAERQRVDRASRRVLFDRQWVMERIATAPAEAVLYARNPERWIGVGGNHIAFMPVGGPPNCHDMDRGRRPGNSRDLADLIRLAHSINSLHTISSGMLAAQDLDQRTRHLDAYLAVATLSDKVSSTSLLGADRALDGIHMNALARGISLDEMRARPGLFGGINTNSPLRVDGPMIQGLAAMVEHGQVVVVTPFTLSGAMGPVTLAGALAQQNAEALAMLAYAQMLKPGTPVVYGSFTSNVDMKSGAPAFGTPEYAKTTIASGQMARRYKLPYRTSNCTASNTVDAQAAYESQMSLWPAVTGHGNFIFHAAGWLEGGLVASFEKMILDAEQLQMMAEFLQPIATRREDFALDALAEVGPGGHFFGAQHTIARYETAFYAPLLSDWRTYQTWEADGARSATERAQRIYKALLANYEPPALDPARREALDDYVARRKRDYIPAAG